MIFYKIDIFPVHFLMILVDQLFIVPLPPPQCHWSMSLATVLLVSTSHMLPQPHTSCPHMVVLPNLI